MNLLFGFSNLNNLLNRDKIQDLIEKEFSHTIFWITPLNSPIQCGGIHDNGLLVGRATDKEHSLLFLGSLINRLPQDYTKNPLDDPDYTAQWLLRRALNHGERFLHGICGHYVVVLSNSRTPAVTLGCDATGFRRIFYIADKDRLLFSTKLSLIPRCLDRSIPLDRSMEACALGFEFLPWGHTYFKDVNVLSGKMLTWSPEKVQKVEPVPTTTGENGYRLKMLPDTGGEEKVAEQLYDVFMSSIEDLCPTRKEVSVLLGGFDSALIAAALKRIGKQVETFSFRYKEEGFNQPHTDLLSDYLGTKHTWVDISPEIIRRGLTDFAINVNQIACQPHYLIQTVHACTMIRQKGYSHCFTGDGCDGLFLGYPTVHRRANLFLKLGGIPTVFLRCLRRILALQSVETFLGHPCRIARNAVTVMMRPTPARWHIAHRVFDNYSLAGLQKGHLPEHKYDLEELLQTLAAGLDGLSPVRLAYHGKAAVGLNRAKIEAASDASGMIIHSPYLHPGLTNFVNSLPENLLRPKEHDKKTPAGKYILAKMVEDQNLLPPEIVSQKKRSPVDSPIDHWYATVLNSFVHDTLDGLPFDYDRTYIESLMRPKIAESLYRRFVAIDHLASHALGLLLTYARFASPIGRGTSAI